MQKYLQVFKSFFAIVLVVGLILVEKSHPAAAADYSIWNDLGIVYTAPGNTAAYYPSVIYDAQCFGAVPCDSVATKYRMWYSDGAGGVFLITSADGIHWGAPTAAASGLFGLPHHVQVLYNTNCFGIVPCDGSAPHYKIWYWNTNALYTIAAIATGQSVDGVTWTNSSSVTQSGTAPLVTGNSSDWNYGSYGPIQLFYQPGATNSGLEPWDYRYVMYYDGAGGQHEVTGLAYSSDGLDWTRYSSAPVLSYGPATWDSDDSAYGAVLKVDSNWYFWYSGGSCTYSVGCPVSEGIGYASSNDGKTWTKAATNPIFHISQGVSYRNQRVYTPAVVVDNLGIFRMYYSAVGTDGFKKIGLATFTPQNTFADDGWVGLAPGTQVTFPGNPDPHFIGMDAFDTVQKAINAVVSSGTVSVAEGTYNELVTINKPLTLQGAGPTLAILNHSSKTATGGTGITVSANDVTIQDLGIQQYNIGIGLNGSKRTSLYRVDASNHYSYGVKNTATGVSYLMINASVFSNNNGSLSVGRGIFLQSNAFDHITITNSTANDNGLVGFDLNVNTTTSIGEVVITGNTVNRNGDCGICAITPGATQVLIANNQIEMTGNQRFGIELKNSNGNGSASGAGSYVVSNNTITQTAAGTNSRDFAGIAIERRDKQTNDVDLPNGVVISGNAVTNIHRGDGTCATCNGYQGDGFGIVVGGTNHQVINNTITNCDIGVQVQAGNLNYPGNSPSTTGQANTPYFDRDNSASASVTLQGNTITNSTTGLRVYGANAVGTVARNILSNNPTTINVQNSATATIKGNTISGGAPVFTQDSGALTAYANNISGFTTAFSGTRATTNLRHNWWGTYDGSAPTGLNSAEWQARLGADVQDWADGTGSASLNGASLSRSGSGIAVIVDHGRGLDNRPFGNGVDPYVSDLCSSFFDIFTENSTDVDWQVSITVDSTPACSSQTLNPKRLLWITPTTDYATVCSPETNNQCWHIPEASRINISGQSLVITNLTVDELGGTQFVAGNSINGNSPTAVRLVEFQARSDPLPLGWAWLAGLAATASVLSTGLVWKISRQRTSRE